MSILISDIAKKAGVSNATVSNALNNRKGVSDEKRELILKVANEMGYYKKRNDESNRIELMIISRKMEIVNDSAFFSELIKGVEKECHSFGMELIIRHINVEDMKKVFSVENLNELTKGYIVLSTELVEEDVLFLTETNIPYVILDASFKHPKFTCVVINNRDGAYNATEHLIRRGHKKIGIINSKYQIENFKEREIGFFDALNDNRYSTSMQYKVIVEPTLEGSYRNMKEFIVSGKELPTAYFTVNDTIAFGVNKALIEMGIRDKISLIGFDDIPVAEMMDPPLTTIKVEKLSLGRLAVNELISICENNKHVPVKIQVNTSIVSRGSVQQKEND